MPSSAPTELLAELELNLTLFLSWVAPTTENINGLLLGYQLNCSTQHDKTMSAVVSGTSVSFQNIQNNTHYTCEVCAYTSVGCGPYAVTHISTYGNCKYILSNATCVLINNHQYITYFNSSRGISSFFKC